MTMVLSGDAGVTFPAGGVGNPAGAVVGTTDTQTLTNKTLTSPTIATPTMTGQATIPTINLTGGQITFPATQSASSDANTLDDYEEGTWTPVITPGAGSLTSYTSGGKYIKIGQAVYLSFYFAITTVGTASGAVNLAGVPFAPIGTSANTQQAIPIVREASQTGVIYAGYLLPNNTTGSITSLTNGAVVWGANYTYICNLVYQTSS